MMPMNDRLSHLQPSAIRSFTALANATPGCIKLTIGEPDFDTPQNIRDAAASALTAGQTHYAPNAGTETLRNAIAEYESRRGMPCEAEQVIVTVGATEALLTAMVGILNPGEEIIVPMPAFPLYQSIATIAGAKLVPLNIAETNFQITEEALAKVITPNTRAILLNSPNNPTGTVLSAESLAVVKKAILGKPIWLISDNVYAALCYEEIADITLDPELAEQRILCQSFSKPYAMTGWRVGYIVAPKEAAKKLLLLHAAEVSGLPPFVQAACVEALQTDVSDMLETYRQRRDYLCTRLDAMGLHYPKPEGAFYVFVDIRPYSGDSGAFCRRMITEAGVAAVPGSCFGAEGYLRFSYCCSFADLQNAMNRLEGWIKTL